MEWHINPFEREYFAKGKDPFQGNQAIPTLIFRKYRKQFNRKFPRLKIIKEEKMDFIIYPLSGGFHNPSLCPILFYPALVIMEELLCRFKSYLAFRLFVVLEKT